MNGTKHPKRPILYHYWRSSSSWRVRWAFALKGIECDFVSVDLLSDEPASETHLKRNPLGYVPVLELSQDGKPFYLSESLAIISWAEERVVTQSLLPQDPLLRARTRQLAEIVNSGIQPLQNPSVQEVYSDDAAKRKAWAQKWTHAGFRAYEMWSLTTAGKFSVGDEITLADLCLIPQIYNAERNGVTLEDYPTLARINRNALATDACLQSHPERFKP